MIKSIKYTSLILLVILTFCFFGCTSNENKGGSGDEQILAGFKNLHQEANKKAVLAFIDENIGKCSQGAADKLVYGYEELQKNALDDLEKQFPGGKEEKWTITIPQGLQKEFGYSFSMDKINSIKDPQLKEILQEVRDTGFLVRTAEGMYFPVINYNFYEKYSGYLTGQAKDYFSIMAEESKRIAVDDGSLQITPNDILKRMKAQQIYINKYPGSPKLRDIKDLYIIHTGFYLCGADNTPAFSYDTKVLNSDFRESYQDYKLNDSVFGGEFVTYFETLKKEGYKLTDKISDARNKLIEKVKQSLE
ncbi:MAG TPA: hypothetical protein DCK76_03105 [Desulfotomaculum sp.]|nr:MAG: Uncharacterized protein XD84_0951 [Desulfotomaculum sp. 46_80]HAG10378.1 hypothetical protein [Desulfotomaculum sp.]HBY04167.1 hypothetical protein [Desulfotomaculum sp.]